MKIDIISGFLGAGKTTFIKRLLETKLAAEKIILIENEFGEVSVDSAILKDTNIDIKEISQGCICCSLVGDFSKALNEVVEKYNPERILIEPSGVGKLSDIVNAVVEAGFKDEINSLVCLVDVNKAKMYIKNFGEFFLDQLSSAKTIILSRTDVANNEKVNEAISLIREHNSNCVLITTPINKLDDETLISAFEGVDSNFMEELLEEVKHHHEEECECGHHHHHHEEECECGHHHHHHEVECECGHHHHHHEEECECGHHHHHHEEECECGHHHHHHEVECECGHHHHHHEEECECGHHHHHHADEVFKSIGIETAKKYDISQLKTILDAMSLGEYGMVVRAKGVVCGTDELWYQFNLTPNEVEIVEAQPISIGKICVIGSSINEEQIKNLF